MKKILLIITATLIIIYTAAWFIIARIAEDRIPLLLENLTKKERSLKKFETVVKVKGFPFYFDVALEHPNIQLEPQNHTGSYNALYDGTIRIRLGLFSSSIKLITNGDLHLKGHINNYRFHLISTGEDTSYKISLKHFLLSPKLYGSFAKAAVSPKYIINAVDKITIYAKDLKTINKLNNTPLFSADKIDLLLRTSVKENSMKVKYEEDLVNARFSNEFLILWNNISSIPAIHNAMAGLHHNIRSYFATFPLSTLGNINHSIKIDIDQDNNTYDITIDKFNIKDAIENISAEGKVYISDTQKTINITSDSKLTPQWHSMMQHYINNINLNLAVPNLRDMGEEIKLDINADYKKRKNEDFDLDIDKFDLNTNNFYINAKGDVKQRAQGDIYKIKLKLGNYEYLINYALDYMSGAKAQESGLFSQIINFKISPETKTEITGFFKGVSDSPDSSSQNLSWTAVNDGHSKYPAIGKYSSAEFEKKLNLLMAKLTAQIVAKEIQRLTKNDFAKDITNALKQKNPEDLFRNLPGKLGF